VVILTVEYLLRLWSSADDTEHLMLRGEDKRRDEAMTRVSWALSLYSLVDLAAIVPYFLDAYSLLITRAACGRGPPPPPTSPMADPQTALRMIERNSLLGCVASARSAARARSRHLVRHPRREGRRFGPPSLAVPPNVPPLSHHARRGPVSRSPPPPPCICT